MMRQTRRIKKALLKLGQTSLIYLGKQMCEVRKLEIFLLLCVSFLLICILDDPEKTGSDERRTLL